MNQDYVDFYYNKVVNKYIQIFKENGCNWSSLAKLNHLTVHNVSLNINIQLKLIFSIFKDTPNQDIFQGFLLYNYKGKQHRGFVPTPMKKQTKYIVIIFITDIVLCTQFL